MNIVYCDCFSGISGDMFLSAMLDAGLPSDYLEAQLKLLNLKDFHGLTARKVMKGALSATQLTFNISSGEHDGICHAHLNQISDLILSSELTDNVKRQSINIFSILAEAEAKVHGSSIEDVHFHEVGAVDSILDIVGAAVSLEYFSIDSLYCSPVPLGKGFVETQHGTLPLPAPATLELLVAAQAPLTSSPAEVELVTPTGAAILATLAQFSQPEMVATKIGLGAGIRDLKWPNVLRLVIGEAIEPPSKLVEIETNIDDMNPQIFGYMMDAFFQAGALDVFYTPIFMKKNRPATKLSIIARKDDEQRICEIMLRESSSTGVRIKTIHRHEAVRKIITVMTQYGNIPVKIKKIGADHFHAAPEYDVCLHLAQQTGVPLLEILREAAQRAHELEPKIV